MADNPQDHHTNSDQPRTSRGSTPAHAANDSQGTEKGKDIQAENTESSKDNNNTNAGTDESAKDGEKVEHDVADTVHDQDAAADSNTCAPMEVESEQNNDASDEHAPNAQLSTDQSGGGANDDLVDINIADQGTNDCNMSVDNLFDAYLKADAHNEPPPPQSFHEWAGLATAKNDGEDDEREDYEAEEKFKKEERAYKRKCRTGTNSQLDDINFKKLDFAERKRKAIARNRDAADDQDMNDEGAQEPLFVPEETVGSVDGPFLKFTDDEEEKHPKKKRKTSKKAKAGAERGKGVTKGQPKKKTTKRKPTGSQQKENNLANMDSLGVTNVFASAQTNTARPDQPTFRSKIKKDAMNELIASIPEEHRSTARVDKNQLEKASKVFGQRMCSTTGEGQWRISGMNSDLAHYQMLGASFMRGREQLDESGTPLHDPAGGLQCDEMGLGKTVMAIAVMANDRYRDSKKNGALFGKPTLIVAPSSLLHQWKEEIYKHAELGVVGPVTMFTSSSDKDDVISLKQQGIVLTTYGQVLQSYPKNDPPVHLTSSEAKTKWWQEHFVANRGILHEMRWRRIILDEATNIKNHRSRTSNACAELNAQFRWALSGTPAMNTIDEFYAYFRFLHIKQAGSFKLFKKNFVTDAEGKERMVAFMRPFMLRRTHHDTLFGSKLLNLPAPAQDTYPTQLDKLHFAVYKIVKQRFVETINVISRRGELKSGNVLTLLLRLRQFVGHPLLIQDCIRDLLEDEDFERIEIVLNERQQNCKHDDRQRCIIQHMRRMLVNRESLPEVDSLSDVATPKIQSQPKSSPTTQPSQESSSSQAENDKPDSPPGNSDVGGTFGLKDNFPEFLTHLRGESKARSKAPPITCARCEKTPRNPVVTTCSHVYCDECSVKDSQEYMERGQAFNRCALCNSAYTLLDRYEPQPQELQPPPTDANTAEQTADNLRMTRKSRGDSKQTKADEIIAAWLDSDGRMLPSAKTQAFKAQILNWLAEDPRTKIIVYTQFVSMMKILSRICTLERWPHLLYHGGLTPAARNTQIERFRAAPELNILFATLSTGGVGLNLTMATRVMMIDPWWNSAVEQQAFCRTYRRGQAQRTYMTRLAAQGTVDEHILRLQARKDHEITSVMGDAGLSRMLPVQELMRLFGEVGQDEAGHPFIYPERGVTPSGGAPRTECAGVETGQDDDA